MAPTSTTSRRPSVGVVARATLRDAAHQASFERDGFVVVALLAADEVARARELPDDALDLAGERLGEVLDDHRLLRSTPFDLPAAVAAGPRQADSAVDEQRFRSVTAWVALDDVATAGDVVLRVVPGSHRAAGEHRGTATTSWPEAHPAAIDLGLARVVVPAGSVIVLDAATVRAWDAGAGAALVAIGIDAVPTEAPLVHAWARPDGDVDVGPIEELDRPEPGTTRREPAAWAPLDEERAARACGVRLHDARAALGASEPVGLGDGGAARVAARLLAAHHRMIATPDDPPFWPTTAFPWVAELQTSWEAIRDEYVAAQVARGLAPLELLAGTPLPSAGTWSALLLHDGHGWAEGLDEHLPRTLELLHAVPGLRTALFSVLAPGARIDPHRGNNKGVLRAHLGIVVPPPPATATLWAGPDHRTWVEGEAFVFDDTFEHRVANRATTPRVSLMIEFRRPLGGVRGAVNALAQHAFQLHPQARGAERRAREVAAALDA